MKIEINECTCKVSPVEKAQHPNLLANVSVSFKGIGNQYFTITGFTIWKSKFGGLSVQLPQKNGFKYLLVEKSLWKKISKEILSQYDYANIPIVEPK
jgi:hypothetical protein